MFFIVRYVESGLFGFAEAFGDAADALKFLRCARSKECGGKDF